MKMVSSYRKNRLFAKYGHECEMANDLDVLPTFIPGENLCAEIKREIVHARMVSEINSLGKKYYRSQGSISNERRRHLSNYPNIIHPFSDARKWWKIFMCFVFLLQFITIPLDLAYYSLPQGSIFDSTVWKWTRMILDSLCFTDVWLNFATGYYNYKKKQAILSPKQIAIHYSSTYFIPDLISSVPTHIEVFVKVDIKSTAYFVLQIASALKLLRIVTFTRYCKDFAEAMNMSYEKHRTGMIVINCFLFGHIIACALILSYASSMGYLHHSSNKKEDSTAEHSLYANGSYPGACYTAIMMITNAHYGKVLPGTDFENILVTVIWMISRLLLIFLIARIKQVMKAVTSARVKYIEMVRQLKDYMSYKQLPEHMQRRLLTYYDFRFQKSYFRESEILSTISGQLRQEIVMHSCRKLVENVAFFKNLPLTLLVRIVSCLRSEVFLVNDVVIRANTPGNSMFFIASGTVAVFTSSGREICHLEDGSHFGEIALVMRDELRVASVVAVEVCELYRLDRKEFVRAIHPYPDLLDNIQRIAADRMERTTMLDEHDRREMATSSSSGLPKIDENLALESKPPKQRLLELLDVIEGRVEKLRKEAIVLEEERDSLLANLDAIRNADLLTELGDNERDDVLHYTDRILNRCHTVELKIQTQRDKTQEEALHQINYLIDCLVVGMKTDADGSHAKCVAYMNACSSHFVEGVTDKNFESALLGCTADDQKRVKKRLQGLFHYISKLSVSSDND